MRYCAILSLLFFLTCSAYAEETRYIHANAAKLLLTPNFGSQVITSVQRGEQVSIIEVEQKWLKVRYKNHEGWVSKLLAKPNPPIEKSSLLDQHDADLTENARRRASANNTTAAARGLRQDGRARESDDSNMNFHALSVMESQKVSDQDAIEFIKQELQ